MRVLKQPFLIAAGLVIMLLASSCSLSSQAAPSTPAAPRVPADHFNTAGNVLISDQFNNRIVELAPMGTSCGPLARATRQCVTQAPARSSASMTPNV